MKEHKNLDQTQAPKVTLHFVCGYSSRKQTVQPSRRVEVPARTPNKAQKAEGVAGGYGRETYFSHMESLIRPSESDFQANNNFFTYLRTRNIKLPALPSVELEQLFMKDRQKQLDLVN